MRKAESYVMTAVFITVEVQQPPSTWTDTSTLIEVMDEIKHILVVAGVLANVADPAPYPRLH